MGFGVWPELKDMAKVTEYPAISLDTVYRNTTPYPQFLQVYYDCRVSRTGTTLQGSSELVASLGSDGSTWPYSLSGGPAIIDLDFPTSQLHRVSQTGVLAFWVAPGWYWKLETLLSGDGALQAFYVMLQAPVASGL